MLSFRPHAVIIVDCTAIVLLLGQLKNAHQVHNTSAAKAFLSFFKMIETYNRLAKQPRSILKRQLSTKSVGLSLAFLTFYSLPVFALTQEQQAVQAYIQVMLQKPNAIRDMCALAYTWNNQTGGSYREYVLERMSEHRMNGDFWQVVSDQAHLYLFPRYCRGAF